MQALTLSALRYMPTILRPRSVTQLGNYLGALKNWVRLQDEISSGDSDASIYFSVVGLHAITLPQDPAKLRQESRDMMAALLAIGLDPRKCTIFRQEQIKEHAELAWYLNCLAPYGRLQRMTTWKVIPGVLAPHGISAETARSLAWRPSGTLTAKRK